MCQQSTMVNSFDWRLLIAVFALTLAIFNVWYSVFRKGRLTYICSRWTAVGIDVSGASGAFFALKIDIINTGSKPIVLKDLLIEAKLKNGKRIFYDPILLFDLTNYIGSMGKDDRITTSQKGMAPLPVAIPPGKQFDFGFEILFMPHDKKTVVQTSTDTPFELCLYSLSERDKKYKLVASQSISTNDLEKLTNGSFSGVLSTSSINKREEFMAAMAE